MGVVGGGPGGRATFLKVIVHLTSSPAKTTWSCQRTKTRMLLLLLAAAAAASEGDMVVEDRSVVFSCLFVWYRLYRFKAVFLFLYTSFLLGMRMNQASSAFVDGSPSRSLIRCFSLHC